MVARRPGQPELYPTVIKPRLKEIEGWLSEGAPEYAITKKLGISNQTWIEAKKKYTEFSDVVLRARFSAGSVMIGKQYSAACGQLIELKKQKVTKDGDVIDIKEEVYIPPNTNAADLWGRNMLPGYVQAKQDTGANVTVTVQLPAVQAELDRITADRARLEAELASIDMLPGPSGVYAAADLPDAGGTCARPDPEESDTEDIATDTEDPFTV